MAKYLNDDVLDALLNAIKNNGTRLSLCEGEPSSYAEATTLKGSGGKAVVVLTISSANFSGPSDGDSSGRKLVKSEQTGVTISEAGTVTYLAVCDSATSKILLITTTGSKAVTAGQSVTISEFKIEVADPV